MGRVRDAARVVFTFAPTRRLAALVAALAVLWLGSGWPVGAAIAALASVLVVLGALLDATLLPAPTDLDVGRELPATLGVGDVVDGRYVVASHWGRPLVVSVHDAMPS